VDQVQVEVVEPEIRQRLAARLLRIPRPVVRVPDLGRNPDVLAPDTAARQDPLEGDPDRSLVPAPLRAVDVPVAGLLKREADGVIARHLQGPRPKARARNRLDHPRGRI